MKKFAIVIYLTGVHLLLVFVVVKSDFRKRVAAHFQTEAKESPHSRFYEVMRRIHLSIDRNVPPDSVLFVGDSLVQGLLCTRVQDNAVNFGIGTDTTVGVIERLETYASIQEAAMVVFGVGLNDIFLDRRPAPEILKNFRTMLALVPDDTPVVISAILPVVDPISGRHLNADIGRVNRALEDLCREADTVWFCDPRAQMTDGDGNLDTSVHSGDGVHLNSKGNEIWISALKDAIEEASGMSNRQGQEILMRNGSDV